MFIGNRVYDEDYLEVDVGKRTTFFVSDDAVLKVDNAVSCSWHHTSVKTCTTVNLISGFTKPDVHNQLLVRGLSDVYSNVAGLFVAKLSNKSTQPIVSRDSMCCTQLLSISHQQNSTRLFILYPCDVFHLDDTDMLSVNEQTDYLFVPLSDETSLTVTVDTLEVSDPETYMQQFSGETGNQIFNCDVCKLLEDIYSELKQHRKATEKTMPQPQENTTEERITARFIV